MPKIDKLVSSTQGAVDSSGGAESSSSAAGEKGSGRRQKMVWPVLFGLYLVLLVGALAVLWPLLKMAGFGIALVMVAAVLVVSLTPLLLLRSTLRRARSSAHETFS